MGLFEDIVSKAKSQAQNTLNSVANQAKDTALASIGLATQTVYSAPIAAPANTSGVSAPMAMISPVITAIEDNQKKLMVFVLIGAAVIGGYFLMKKGA